MYRSIWVDVRSPTPARVPHPVSCNVNKAYSFMTALIISLIPSAGMKRDSQIISESDPGGNIYDVRGVLP